ncbi:type II secretion system F family protein [Proteinivorax tanatarense]|uniref:Type II secretion system F family protein n=1 Tax=Proteinivorax tanatarense TaxID=1260629 RepID=A0AAU7VP16_9FIRM
MNYRYIGKDTLGNVVKGNIEAENQQRALWLLKEKEVFVTKIKEVEQTQSIGQKGRIKLKDMAIFCNQLSAMVESGVPVAKALKSLQQQTESKVLKRNLVEVVKDIEGGKSLSESLKEREGAFPQIFISLIEVGEMGGVLDVTLKRLAEFFEREKEINDKVKSALTYPAFIMAFSGIAIIFLLVFVVPNFVQMFVDMGVEDELPTITVVLISITDLLRQNFITLIIIVLAAFILAKYLWVNEKIAKYIDGKKIHLPIFGSLLRKVALSKFTKTLAIMVQSGVDIVTALSLVSKTVENRDFEERILEAREHLREGTGLVEQLKANPFIDTMAIQMIEVGEETGSLDKMLDKVAKFNEDEVKHTTDRVSSLIEPIMIVVLAVIVAVILLAVLLPMFDLLHVI